MRMTTILALAGLVLMVGGGACLGSSQAYTPAARGSATPPPESAATAAPGAQTQGAIYYVRPDGGDATQCTGRADAPYPGGGTGQPCAWDHPFRALPPGGPPRISGGDTLIIAAGQYEMGYSAPGADTNEDVCAADYRWGCYMAAIPGGPDPAHPTRILGAGWDAGCSSPPELWGAERADMILNLTDSSNVELACLEITDHSSCIEDHLFPTGGSPFTCQRDTPSYGDWAATGLYAEDSANVHLKDLNIHGLANAGVLAGRLTDWTVENVHIVGNGSVGWNGDLVGDGSNSENHGTLAFRHWVVEWNGCGETYPDEQHIGCWGQEAGGYGDGVGIGTTGGHWVIEDSAFLHNTSDGLDLLYARLPDATIEIRRTIAEGNAGNQIKTTGAVTMENVIVVSNCGFFEGFPYWNSDDNCRAGGDALAFALNPGGHVSVVNATITGEGGCLAIAECALDQTCDGTEMVLMRNTLFQGQEIFFNPTEDTCFAWYDDESSPPMPANPFVVDYSLLTGVRFGNVTPCPGQSNLCGGASGLVNTAIDAFDAHLLPDSAAIDAGMAEGAPADDFEGHPRDAAPDIGAYEGSDPLVYLPLVARNQGAPQIAGCPVFPADNIWNTPVDALPVDANSAAYVATIGAGAYVHADFGSGEWPPDSGAPIGIPYTTVLGTQTMVSVTFQYDDESDLGPYPIPPDAPIEGGPASDGDRHVLVVDRDACMLYELYAAYSQPDGSWEAGSGAIFDLNSHALRPAGWTSADAAGLPILPGLVRYEEVAAGEIRHAIRFTAPDTRQAYVWPARHYASDLTGAQYPPMGQRFRLRADYDISGFSPEVQVILRALKKYGMILADNGSAWYISGAPDERWDNDALHELHNVPGSAFEAVDVSSLMVDADSGQARSGP